MKKDFDQAKDSASKAWECLLSCYDNRHGDNAEIILAILVLRNLADSTLNQVSKVSDTARIAISDMDYFIQAQMEAFNQTKH